MNRLLTLIVVLLVLGIALSRTNEILIALSPYPAADLVPAAPEIEMAAEPVLIESELAGRSPE